MIQSSNCQLWRQLDRPGPAGDYDGHAAVTPLTGTRSAAQCVALMSTLLGFAITRGLRSDNPARGVKKPLVRKIERFLSEDEIARLAVALDAESRRTGNPYPAAAIKLLLLTGGRRGEILGLQWHHVDFERQCLRLPDSKTGAKIIYLNAPALAVLNGAERIGPFVIPGDVPEQPRHDLKRPWDIVTKLAKLIGVRLHDLRHTYASFGAGSGLGLPIIGRLLGHAQPATTARYAHLDNDPLRRASEAIAGGIAAALQGNPTSPFRPLRRTA